ncbi:MAG: hypothetical protein HC884_12365 [Chloroflexaceae bacterium]|nr:hypothetical protein [Chloroflexaceae bacterium]
MVELVPSIILYQPLYTFAASNELGGMGFEAPESASNLLLVGAEDRYRQVSGWFIERSREIRGNVR